jgi:RNase P/RNase MRP subunit POP5
VKGEVARGDLARKLAGLSSGIRAKGPKLRLVLYDVGSGRGLLRCGHLQIEALMDKLVRVDEIMGEKVKLGILGVSGTIKAAKRKFLSLS